VERKKRRFAREKQITIPLGCIALETFAEYTAKVLARYFYEYT